MASLVKALDFNGSLSQLSFFGNDVKFRTIQGGILSIMIYGIGSSYFFYLMFMWHTNQIPPIVTNQLEFYPEIRFFKLTNPLFVFSLEVGKTDQLSLHQQSTRKIYDLQITSSRLNYSGMSLSTNPDGFNCFQEKQDHDYFDPICLNLNDQFQTNLAQNYKNRSQDIYVELDVISCNPSNDIKCLNFDEQNHIFYDLNGRWRLTLITQDVDLYTGNVINIPQDYYFFTNDYQAGVTLNFDLKVQKTTYIIDTGLLFPNEKKIEIVRSVQYTCTIEYLAILNLTPLTAVIRYSLDRQEQVIKVTHPKLGQILAELGSILQVLLLIGMLMNHFNSILMTNQAEEAILKSYFPQMKLFKFLYSFRGKIRSIQFRGKDLDRVDFEHMRRLRVNLGQQVRSKLNYINILHEISRLQMALQIQLPRQEIIQLQGFGYRLKLPQKFMSDNVDDLELQNQDLFLNYDLFEDLSRFHPKDESKLQDSERVYTFGELLNQNPTPTIVEGLSFRQESLRDRKKLYFIPDSSEGILGTREEGHKVEV